MNLDKSIEKGTEHRKPYYRRCYIMDYTCRNHGGKTKRHSGGQCLVCLRDRMYQTNKENERIRSEVQNGFSDSEE